MISNQVLQNTLEGLKEISRTEFCVIDTDGKVLASTFSDFEIQPADISWSMSLWPMGMTRILIW